MTRMTYVMDIIFSELDSSWMCYWVDSSHVVGLFLDCLIGYIVGHLWACCGICWPCVDHILRIFLAHIGYVFGMYWGCLAIYWDALAAR